MTSGFTHESQHNDSKEWYTPKYVFDAIGIDYDIDVASPGANIVPWVPAKNHYTKEDDGLWMPWEGRIWCNPPYGNDTHKWVKKFLQHKHGIMLVFARTDTGWFHDYVVHADCILFAKKRIKFLKEGKDVGSAGGCGSMFIGCGQDCVEALEKSNLGFLTKRGSYNEVSTI